MNHGGKQASIRDEEPLFFVCLSKKTVFLENRRTPFFDTHETCMKQASLHDEEPVFFSCLSGKAAFLENQRSEVVFSSPKNVWKRRVGWSKTRVFRAFFENTTISDTLHT